MEHAEQAWPETHSPQRTGGFCRRCGREHWLGPGNTGELCNKLMERLDRLKSIDLSTSLPASDGPLSTTPLFGEGRGKMFGVLECVKPDGTAVNLYGFSGQYNGLWLAEGWVPPLFDVRDFLSLTLEREQQIKQLGRTIARCAPHSDRWLALRKTRRELSRQLMKEIHGLYRLWNFRGERTVLAEAFHGDKGIPTGTGDCCGPKLLNFAARNQLRPLGIGEFFWGRENKSRQHSHGDFSAACREKCQPILGFMLCGLTEMP